MVQKEELIARHVSGRLKVAPEHTEDDVLYLMRKPSFRGSGRVYTRACVWMITCVIYLCGQCHRGGREVLDGLAALAAYIGRYGFVGSVAVRYDSAHRQIPCRKPSFQLPLFGKPSLDKYHEEILEMSVEDNGSKD